MRARAEVRGYSLDKIVETVRHYAGVSGKGPISAIRASIDVSDPIHGPGDDGAIVEVGDHHVVVCGEALSPPFVEADPYGAGIAAVLANVNDVAAMGGTPLGIVNTLVGPAEVTAEVMRGMVDASKMYDVPIVGGHLTERPGDTSVSAFAVGEAPGVLSMAHVAEGQTVLFACFLDGEMRTDFPFFRSIDQQAHRFADDVRVLAEVSKAGAAASAKDVSMAGPLGSLAMLLEFKALGADIDLELLPVPENTDFLQWSICFPSYAFWLTCEPNTVEACRTIFHDADLHCEVVGTVTTDSIIRLSGGGDQLDLLDFRSDSITGLWASDVR
jgi:selenophosphate synthetase-related protein